MERKDCDAAEGVKCDKFDTGLRKKVAVCRVEFTYRSDVISSSLSKDSCNIFIDTCWP